MSNQEYGTIRIPRDEFEEHNDRRKDLGLTWVEYLNSETTDAPGPVDVEDLSERLESVIREVSMADEPGVDVNTAELVDELDGIQSSVGTIEERVGRLERMLEDMEGRMR